ncbi:single-stranded DNA-binding protein [Pseudomonas viridiflava]|uniref:single-stranded DNA-binding protein n=1 Tax=Pseudomonas viridiflava TaxID=33069 RepID=UPI000F03A172|nr:single-stranded DNA-binding protein [Pseudomonas viridiflava]
MSMNKLNITGNLAADARYNKVKEGSFAVSFTVICNKRVKDQAAEGGYRDQTTPYQVSRFLTSEDSAKKLAEHLTRGRSVDVEGAFRKNAKSNTGTNGKTYHGWSVIADEIELGAKPKPKADAQAAA